MSRLLAAQNDMEVHEVNNKIENVVGKRLEIHLTYGKDEPSGTPEPKGEWVQFWNIPIREDVEEVALALNIVETSGAILGWASAKYAQADEAAHRPTRFRII